MSIGTDLPPELALQELLHDCKGARTQQEWADELGVDQTTVSRWLSGEAIPRSALLFRLLRRYPEHRERFIALMTAPTPPRARRRTETVRA